MIFDILDNTKVSEAEKRRKHTSNKGNENPRKRYNFQQTPPVAIRDGKQVRKGVRWMPRLLQAMKDVISCDKSRGGANNL